MRELSNIVYTLALGFIVFFGILAIADAALERQAVICQESC